MQDNQALAHAADIRSKVNEKLLKALIAILAIKDKHLLNELCVVFEHAQQHGGEIGTASPEVWRGVNHQIGVLQDLVSDEEEDEALESADQKH